MLQAPPRRSALATLDSGPVRTAGSVAAAAIVFALLLIANGTDPVEGYRAMWDSVTRDSNSFGDVLVRLTPYLLAALAVVVPARAGMFNIGGEGQLLIGAVGAMVAANTLDQAVGRGPTLVCMAIAGMLAAALWPGIAAAFREWTGTNEAMSTLLLNYVAALILAWLVFGRWKDPAAAGYPRTRILDDVESLPLLWGRVHIGILIALGAAVSVWAVLRYTSWGFRLGVLGGNAEAARRAGLRTGRLSASALMVGGALAGLGGMLQVSGVEQQLRPGLMSGYGFIGVLAAWMVRHHPLKAILSAGLLAAIAVGGNGLKIRAGLSGASVNILMALMLLAVLGWGTPRRRTV
ncbi:MAG: ABC transporter permease [Acidimicrobiales bacterium]|nr:MAG: ABC transporter permease [Acidimicrobiales bacterium]